MLALSGKKKNYDLKIQNKNVNWNRLYNVSNDFIRYTFVEKVSYQKLQNATSYIIT